MKQEGELTESEFINFTAREFQLKPNELDLSDEFRNLRNWSSLNALIYISAINDNYGVLISSTELSKSKTLENLYHLIEASH
jgi:acyl carrier protein